MDKVAGFVNPLCLLFLFEHYKYLYSSCYILECKSPGGVVGPTIHYTTPLLATLTIGVLGYVDLGAEHPEWD